MLKNPVIIYVDDEPRNLAVFEASMPDNWDIHIFDNPIEACKEFEILNPTLVLSDQRMPGMSGVEVLEEARKKCPDAIRIIVTGYSDEDLVIESVRKAKIYDYIRKPWDVDELEHRLLNAIDFFISEKKNKTEKMQLLFFSLA